MPFIEYLREKEQMDLQSVLSALSKDSVSSITHNSPLEDILETTPILPDSSSLTPTKWNNKKKHVVQNICYDKFLSFFNCSFGKLVLNYFQIHKELNNKMRNLLVNILVTNLVTEPNHSLHSNTLSEISEHIIRLFPSESQDLYFIHNSKGISSGKLLFKYQNHKKSLIQNEKKKKNVPGAGTPIPINVAEMHEKMTWLRDNVMPWHRVVEYWCDTARQRQETNYGDIHSIVQLYPVIKLSTGKQLVSISNTLILVQNCS